MIGSRRNDSSTIRATPSASGEERSRRNFAISSSALSEELILLASELAVVPAIGALAWEVVATPPESDADVSKTSSGTPRARDIFLNVPACGLLVLPRSIW